MKRFSFLLYFIATCSWGQQADLVDFKSADVKVWFAPDSSKVFGKVVYKFDVLKSVDSIFLDAINMRFSEVSLDGNPVRYSNNGTQVWFKSHFEVGEDYQLNFEYSAKPTKALYFIDWGIKNNVTSSDSDVNRNNIEKRQIWTQGQGKYTSNWLPSIDDMNDKIEFDLSINFDNGYEVISNGILTKNEDTFGKTVWQFDMKQPMSSYLVALAIGKYHKTVEYSKSGIPLEMYYYPEDSLKVEPTYRYTKQMFDFLETEIGVAYPWQNYKQVPVKDFLYAGMENTSCTIFSDAFVVDSIAFVDKNYVNVNAHELAHQWFGNLVTETSGTHHWLHEGFATYYALLAERDVFGDDYYHWRLYEYAQELLEQDKAGGSTSLLDPKSSSTTFYKKGAWVLHLLREQVGDGAFKTAVKNYLKKHQFKNVETDDFISEVEKVSGEDLSEFVGEWLVSPVLFYGELMESINLTRRMELMVSLEDDVESQIKTNEKGVYSSDLEKALPIVKANLKVEDSLIGYKDGEFNQFCEKALDSKSLKIRQAVAQTLTEIPFELKPDYETLLKDKSYITIEAALFNLWKNFPQERSRYLNQTKGIIGFNDKNVRILWLTLALLTENFEPENQSKYLDELIGYTSPNYGFETRINAFQYLTQIRACNDECKAHLQQATTHHNWQMVKFSKSLQSQMEQ